MPFGVMFHHFDSFHHPKSQGSISRNQIYKIIKFLKKSYNLNNANEFMDKLISKKIKQKDVCLTFDDSLKCQVDVALPVVNKEKIQAFFFLHSCAFSRKSNLLEVFRGLIKKCL